MKITRPAITIVDRPSMAAQPRGPRFHRIRTIATPGRTLSASPIRTGWPWPGMSQGQESRPRYSFWAHASQIAAPPSASTIANTNAHADLLTRSPAATRRASPMAITTPMPPAVLDQVTQTLFRRFGRPPRFSALPRASLIHLLRPKLGFCWVGYGPAMVGQALHADASLARLLV
jgi:hypothetical protein